MDEMQQKPRRRIVFIAKIEADTWTDLQNRLQSVATDIAMNGKLSPSSVSGGYGSGHIIVTSEDCSIDHDSWARELNKYLESLSK